MNVKDWGEIFLGTLILKNLVKDHTFKSKKRYDFRYSDKMLISKNGNYHGYLVNSSRGQISYINLHFMNSSNQEIFELKFVIHREGDLPALELLGDSRYYKDGIIHREGDLPAINSYEYVKYYKNGLIHRDGDLPAVILYNGDKIYYKYGKQYRENGLKSCEPFLENVPRNFYENRNFR